MSHKELRELLAQLHSRLSQAKSLDADARASLTTVLHDIERLLARSGKDDAAPASPRLEALAVRFEADHPALADVVRQLIDTLGKAGI